MTKAAFTDHCLLDSSALETATCHGAVNSSQLMSFFINHTEIVVHEKVYLDTQTRD